MSGNALADYYSRWLTAMTCCRTLDRCARPPHETGSAPALRPQLLYPPTEERVELHLGPRPVLQGPFTLKIMNVNVARARVVQSPNGTPLGIIIPQTDPQHQPALRNLPDHVIGMVPADRGRQDERRRRPPRRQPPPRQ